MVYIKHHYCRDLNLAVHRKACNQAPAEDHEPLWHHSIQMVDCEECLKLPEVILKRLAASEL